MVRKFSLLTGLLCLINTVGCACGRQGYNSCVSSNPVNCGCSTCSSPGVTACGCAGGASYSAPAAYGTPTYSNPNYHNEYPTNTPVTAPPAPPAAMLESLPSPMLGSQQNYLAAPAVQLTPSGYPATVPMSAPVTQQISQTAYLPQSPVMQHSPIVQHGMPMQTEMPIQMAQPLPNLLPSAPGIHGPNCNCGR